MSLHALTLADVLTHMGIGGLFICGQSCTRRVCKHTLTRLASGGLLAVAEATLVVAVVG